MMNDERDKRLEDFAREIDGIGVPTGEAEDIRSLLADYRALRAERDRARDAKRRAEESELRTAAEMDEVQAERDRWEEMYDEAVKMYRAAYEELHGVRAERDRLREAAQEMLDYTSNWSDVRMHGIRNKIRAALASGEESGTNQEQNPQSEDR